MKDFILPAVRQDDRDMGTPARQGKPVSLTIDGIRTTYRPGETWDLAAGVVHAVEIKAGSRAIDVFEEPDRYKLRP